MVGIDGYRRRKLWLKVGPSNNDPGVIASYLSRIHQIGGVLMILPGDRGTENVHVAGMRRFLRRNSCDALSRE